ncbi:hypothetical protein [Candidatus Poriferisodalis sp.]|uniref:hypothetical protein n=1 Tax=Candidatus Poriferisodalis sp. TaxID=3101277 RepID=UPI003C6F4A4E
MISPRDDGIAAWIKFGAWFLAAVGFWLFGLAGIPTGAMVPGAGLVVVLSVAASLGAAQVVNVHAHSLAGRGSSAAASVENVLLETDSSATRWRAARWPDGRYVAAGGVVAYIAAFAASVTLILAIWLLGRMSAPDLGVSSWWGSLGYALLMPMTFVGIVSSRRLTALALNDAADGRAAPGSRAGAGEPPRHHTSTKTSHWTRSS